MKKAKPYKVIQRSAGEYIVKKPDGSAEYTVTVGQGELECTCEGFTWRQDCKHLAMISNFVVELDRLATHDALQRTRTLLEELEKLWVRYEICGSARRGRSNVKDIDVVVEGDFDDTKGVLVEAGIPLDVSKGVKDNVLRFHWKSVPIDLVFVDSSSWGAALMYYTGPKALNRLQRQLAKRKGFKLTRWGLWEIESGDKVAGATEEEIYTLLGERMLSPHKREEYRTILGGSES